MSSGIKVFAPATITNLGPGHQLLGLALNKLGDEIILRKTDSKGIVLSHIKNNIDKNVPNEPAKNSAVIAAQIITDHCNLTDIGIEIYINKNMPTQVGLGSDETSSIATMWGLNNLLNLGMTKTEILEILVANLNRFPHPLQATHFVPAMLGGFIFIKNINPLDIHRLPTPNGMFSAVIIPDDSSLRLNINTIQSTQIQYAQMINQTGNLGGLILGLYKSDIDLIGRSLHDNVINQYIALQMPIYSEIRNKVKELGGLGCNISGMGPGIAVLCPNSLIAEEIAFHVEQIFKTNKIMSSTHVSKINQEGALIC